MVSQLVTKFMEENTRVQREQTDSASGFIGESLKAAKEKVARRLVARIAEALG